MIKKVLLMLVPLGSLLLMSCATERVISHGTVTSSQKIAGVSYKPKQETAIGAGIGTGTGATIGAAIGGSLGTGIAVATLGLGIPLVPALAVGGAVVGGGIGSVAGGGAGYAVGIHNQGKGLYQFTVKLDDQAEDIIVTQYMQQSIQVQERVIVYDKNGKLKLEKYRD